MEEKWRKGERPKIEEHVELVDGSDRVRSFGKLLGTLVRTRVDHANLIPAAVVVQRALDGHEQVPVLEPRGERREDRAIERIEEPQLLEPAARDPPLEQAVQPADIPQVERDPQVP